MLANSTREADKIKSKPKRAGWWKGEKSVRIQRVIISKLMDIGY